MQQYRHLPVIYHLTVKNFDRYYIVSKLKPDNINYHLRFVAGVFLSFSQLYV